MVTARRLGGVEAAGGAVLVEWLNMDVLVVTGNGVVEVVLLCWSRLAACVVVELVMPLLVFLIVDRIVAVVLACVVVRETDVDGGGSVDGPKQREPFKRRLVCSLPSDIERIALISSCILNVTSTESEAVTSSMTSTSVET